MKKLSLIVIILQLCSLQSQASDSLRANLLQSYYNLKNALIAGDQANASTQAAILLKELNGIDYKIISEGNIKVLVKAAGKISTANHIDKQRKYFENLSENMILVAKSVNLGSTPVYVIYCPMKKASWLNNTPEVFNPYYGESMLRCGEVRQTIDHRR